MASIPALRVQTLALNNSSPLAMAGPRGSPVLQNARAGARIPIDSSALALNTSPTSPTKGSISVPSKNLTSPQPVAIVKFGDSPDSIPDFPQIIESPLSRTGPSSDSDSESDASTRFRVQSRSNQSNDVTKGMTRVYPSSVLPPLQQVVDDALLRERKNSEHKPEPHKNGKGASDDDAVEILQSLKNSSPPQANRTVAPLKPVQLPPPPTAQVTQPGRQPLASAIHNNSVALKSSHGSIQHKVNTVQAAAPTFSAPQSIELRRPSVADKGGVSLEQGDKMAELRKLGSQLFQFGTSYSTSPPPPEVSDSLAKQLFNMAQFVDQLGHSETPVSSNRAGQESNPANNVCAQPMNNLPPQVMGHPGPVMGDHNGVAPGHYGQGFNYGYPPSVMGPSIVMGQMGPYMGVPQPHPPPPAPPGPHHHHHMMQGPMSMGNPMMNPMAPVGGMGMGMNPMLYPLQNQDMRYSNDERTGIRRRKRQRSDEVIQCHDCGTTETPEWRRGPDGARTLCNACGLHHAKLSKKSEGDPKDKERERERTRRRVSRGRYAED